MFINSALNLQAYDRVLFIQLRAMGDTLLLTPLLRSFKNTYPNVHIDVLVESLPAQILKGNPYIRNIHVAPPKGAAFRAYKPIIKKLRSEDYTLVIDFLSTPGSALLTYLTGAKIRIGYKLRWRSWAYSYTVHRRSDMVYNPLTKFDLAQILDVKSDSLDLDVTIGIDDEKGADKVWEGLGLSASNIVYALAPWSKRSWRRWENDAWLDVLKSISKHGLVTWLLFAAENERGYLKELEENSSIDVRWSGAADLLIAAALMKRCKAMLNAENGLKHLAVAVKIPTLTVFTGSEPSVWNPPDDPYHPFIDLRDTECSQSTINRISELFKRICK